jgi:uncharacterized protein (DUF427 family)
MKWFKHDVDASNDSRIRKLKRKFGMEGYGIYFNTLELVARGFESNLGMLPIEWDDDALEMEFETTPDKIRTVFKYMVQIGLFEETNGQLFNPKIVNRCDDYTARLLRKENIQAQSTDNVRTSSDSVCESPLRNRSRDRNRSRLEVEKREASPAQSTRGFFDNTINQTDEFHLFVQSIAQKHHLPPEAVRMEVLKFTNYWTELNKSGTKQRWELEKTFEVNRRLMTWFSRVRDFNNIKEAKGITL